MLDILTICYIATTNLQEFYIVDRHKVAYML